MAKNILTLNSSEAIEFFLKSEQYHGFELPEYFVFDTLLRSVREVVGDTPYDECLNPDAGRPERLDGVNLDILLNKDGRYAVRPIILANPYLYYFLVREVCSEPSWTIIKGLFEKFTVPHLTSCAMPVIPNEKEAFYKSATILNWWNGMEQRSIELALEYRYMFVTDITNCYGSVNPQAFEWAFDIKGTEFEHPCELPIAANIQKYLSAMQQGRNIGIPQGSAIFDFVGEIILGYSDLLLHEAIRRAQITSAYEIIRYRDDYRIFCNDRNALEKISYLLQHTLEGLNFRMNSQKTRISESIVTDSVKPDKLAYIFNTPIFNKKGCDFDSFEKHLLYILMFARKYPDSGSVKTMLSDIDKRIKKWLEPQKGTSLTVSIAEILGTEIPQKTAETKTAEVEETEPVIETYSRPLVGGSVRAMSAICTQIALENVGACHYALRVLSRMVDSLTDEDEKRDIICKVYAKLCTQPNSTYNQLWLQNITYQHDKQAGTSPYTLSLCQLAAGNEVAPLWNNDWLKPRFTDCLPYESIVDAETLRKVTPVIVFREVRAYYEN